jgi:beta-lactamase superfamily II metal-dependent hydrolase
MMTTLDRFLLALFLAAANIWAQANGKLQLHFIDVGQGDGAILISPGGQVLAFDIGQDIVSQNCDKPVAYYAQLGIRQLDYLFVSHYHEDHLGCVPNILASARAGQVEDRGQSYASTFYDAYAAATTGKRATPRVGDMFVLDAASPNPVRIEVFAVNANGAATTSEDALSLSARISYGGFRAEIGGDLTGENTDGYLDVESGVAGAVGKLDVYKVHHHCSSSSSNAQWLALTRPTIAIISAGDGNTYGHPTADCLERLHSAGARTYWTEQGAGATPIPGWDTVSGTAVVSVDLAAIEYTVAYGAKTDVYTIGSGPGATPATPAPSYAWSKLSGEYHYITCEYVKSISPDNLETGNVPPAGKTLHHDCPTQH